MKTVSKKIRMLIDAWPMRSSTDEPVVMMNQIRQMGYVPDLIENGTRSIVEVEVQVPVLIEETELPPAKAILEV